MQFWQIQKEREQRYQRQLEAEKKAKKDSTLRKMTKKQIEFIKENASMDAYAGIRLTDEEVNKVINADITQYQFLMLSRSLRSYSSCQNNYFELGKSAFRDNVRDAFINVTNVCKEILAEAK